jgi:hypothetical protein
MKYQSVKTVPGPYDQNIDESFHEEQNQTGIKDQR